MKHPMPVVPEIANDSNVEENVRFVEKTFGTDREVKSSSICCICDKNIWVVSNPGRATLMEEAFSLRDARAYVFGTPDYIQNSNVLLKYHNVCQIELINQLNAGTFIRR